MIQKNTKFLISVFIPVYNGEKYIKETVHSLLRQTYENFEVYAVDDSSTDDSFNILKSIEMTDNRFHALKKENGGTVPKSWNFVLPKLKGEFYFYMSQDDLLSPDIFEKMVERYIETGAKVIIPDLEFFLTQQSGKKLIGLDGDRTAVLNNSKALISSLKWEIHGFALRHKSLYENVTFPEFSYDTDELMNRIFFYRSDLTAFSEGTFFYRQDNPSAITKVFNSKSYFHVETLWTLYLFLKRNEVNIDAQKELLYSILYNTNKMQKDFIRGVGIKGKSERRQIQEMLHKISHLSINEAKASLFFNDSIKHQLRIIFLKLNMKLNNIVVKTK